MVQTIDEVASFLAMTEFLRKKLRNNTNAIIQYQKPIHPRILQRRGF